MICPFCNEEIKDWAKKCRFCWEFLEWDKNVVGSTERKEKSNKEKISKSKWFIQFIIFAIAIILSTSFSFDSRILIPVVILICIRYALCSKKDNKVIDFKSCIKPERYKNTRRIILASILVILFWCISILWFVGQKKQEKYQANYDSAPTPTITIFSEEWNIWDNTKYVLNAEIKDANEVTVNWDKVEIINWKISKELILQTPKLEINISAKNDYKSSSHTINIDRNMTEEEAEQARIEEEKRIAEEKAAQEEAEKLEAEQKAIYSEKQSRIDKLKSQCRISYDEFEKITWLEPKTFKNTNNQNAIEIYIWKYDNWTIIRRFKIMYAAKNRLFIKNYQFSIWWEVINYYPDKSVQRDNYTTIWEWSDNAYDTKVDNIVKKLIENNWWTIRFNGSQYYDDRTITQKEINTLKDMNELYELLQEKVRLWY